MSVALSLGTLALGGCASEPRYQVAGGSIESGAWSAWAFAGTNENKTCLEIVAAQRDTTRLCNLEASDTGSWQPDTTANASVFVAGHTIDPRAVKAMLTLGDGSSLDADVVGAPEVGPVRFFVLVAPRDLVRDHVDLLDAAGTTVATLDLR